MGATVGPERYLRLLAERALLDGQHRPPTGSALERAAAALAGAGVLGGEVAHRVVEEYGLAAAVRGRLPPDWRNYVGVPGSTATVELRPPTVVPGPIDVALPVADLTILWVRFGDEDTVIGVIAMLAMGIPAGGPPSLQVADDRGTSGTATLGNVRGSGDGRFQVTFTTVPLSAKTAWLELNGRRVVLPARRPSGAQVLIEPVPSRSSALGYLWHEAAVSVDPLPRPRDTTASIEALVAVGAVDPSDPELQAVRDVSAALGGRGRPFGTGTGRPLPEPWASLLVPTSHSRSGPRAIVPVGAVTPPVDGVTVAVDVVDVQPEGFTVEVVAAPGWGLQRRFGWPPADGLAWWAEDDRGGVHLGHVNGGGGPEKARGTVEFPGGLDPEAEELRIIPSGVTERAIVRIPLPRRVTGTDDPDRTRCGTTGVPPNGRRASGR